MTLEELKARVAAVLALECVEPTDWAAVAELSRLLIYRLMIEPEPDYPNFVYHYLEDDDVRRKSSKYAESQRAEVSKWLGMPNPAQP